MLNTEWKNQVALISGAGSESGISMARALEVARNGITVNSVAPGWIGTGSSLPEETHAAQFVPIGRAGRRCRSVSRLSRSQLHHRGTAGH